MHQILPVLDLLSWVPPPWLNTQGTLYTPTRQVVLRGMKKKRFVFIIMSTKFSPTMKCFAVRPGCTDWGDLGLILEACDCLVIHAWKSWEEAAHHVGTSVWNPDFVVCQYYMFMLLDGYSHLPACLPLLTCFLWQASECNCTSRHWLCWTAWLLIFVNFGNNDLSTLTPNR